MTIQVTRLHFFLLALAILTLAVADTFQVLETRAFHDRLVECFAPIPPVRVEELVVIAPEECPAAPRGFVQQVEVLAARGR
jgi:hypothetical protein